MINNSEVENLLNEDKSFENTPSKKIREFQIDSSYLNSENVIQKCDLAKKEYLTMVIDVHTLLKNRESLDNYQKLEYCNSERYYIKQYLKYTLIKVNKCFPD